MGLGQHWWRAVLGLGLGLAGWLAGLAGSSCFSPLFLSCTSSHQEIWQTLGLETKSSKGYSHLPWEGQVMSKIQGGHWEQDCSLYPLQVLRHLLDCSRLPLV